VFETLGNLGDFLGGVGVLGTLLYLAYQIRQNTRSIETSAFQAALSDVTSTMQGVAHDPEMARILFDGHRDFLSMNRDERRRYAVLVSIMLRRYENLVFQTRQGNLDPALWSGLEHELRQMFALPGTQAWWSRARESFNQDLQHYIGDEILRGPAV
jgi:hypothetical protein